MLGRTWARVSPRARRFIVRACVRLSRRSAVIGTPFCAREGAALTARSERAMATTVKIRTASLPLTRSLRTPLALQLQPDLMVLPFSLFDHPARHSQRFAPRQLAQSRAAIPRLEAETLSRA